MLRALVALFLLSIVACGQNEKTNDQGTTFLLPWAESADSKPTLQHVHITTLRNPANVEGPAARIFVKAGVRGHGFAGPAVQARWIKSGSLFVPSDVKSGQAVAVYAHYEKIWQMDVKLGIAQNLTWPRQVSLGTSASIDDTDNAYYSDDYDVMVILPYTADGTLMTLNRGVIGHEHFHGYFEKVFAGARENYYKKKNRTTSDRLVLVTDSPSKHISPEWTSNEHNSFLMSAFNEGLADFFAYVYTSQTNSMAKSVPFMKNSRQLDQGDASLLTADQWEFLMTKPEAVKNPKCERHCRKYILGTRFARQLYQMVQIQAQQKNVTPAVVRASMAAMIIQSLPRVAEKFSDAEMSGEKIEPQQLFNWLVQP